MTPYGLPGSSLPITFCERHNYELVLAKQGPIYHAQSWIDSSLSSHNLEEHVSGRTGAGQTDLVITIILQN